MTRYVKPDIRVQPGLYQGHNHPAHQVQVLEMVSDGLTGKPLVLFQHLFPGSRGKKVVMTKEDFFAPQLNPEGKRVPRYVKIADPGTK